MSSSPVVFESPSLLKRCHSPRSATFGITFQLAPTPQLALIFVELSFPLAAPPGPVAPALTLTLASIRPSLPKMENWLLIGQMPSASMFTPDALISPFNDPPVKLALYLALPRSTHPPSRAKLGES